MEMTPEKWDKIKALFDAALQEASTNRGAFLARNCADEDVRRQVEKLLIGHEGAGSFLQYPIVGADIPTPGEVFSEFSAQPTATGKSLRAAESAYTFEDKSESAQPAPESANAEDPMVGRQVGKYILIQRIGLGGMATVYLAARADEEYRKQVAIKIVPPGINTSELLSRFRTERQTLAALDHPNIVKLLDGGSTEDGLPYLVMDCVDGLAIDKYCDNRNLSVEQRLRLFCTVCAAVEHAHKKRVIHRDLKPSNILITADGVSKLLDFGIAKVLGPDAQPFLTQTGTHRLTPAYASPEQVRRETVTVASDVYALGVVLYELLTGHRPYKLKQHTPAELEQAICEEEPENPSTAVDRIETEITADGTTVTKTPELVSQTREGQPDKLRRCLRGDLDNIVLKALHKEPLRRYSSVRELSDDIQRHLDHLPVKARRSSLGYRSSKFCKRHKPEVVAGAMAVLVVLGAIAFSTWEARHAAENAEAQLKAQRSKGRRSVAVMGFQNLSGRSDTAWLSTALSDMLTTELSAGGKLRIIPGEDVAQTKINLSLSDTDTLSKQALTRVYKNLGSDFVVLGSYLDIGDSNRNIRLDLRVQDAALGETVAAIAEGGSETALPDLVTRAGADLRQKLGISAISPAESASAQASLPSNPESARFYAEGLAKLRVYDAVTARNPLQRAIAAQPEFALAHAALADCWAALGYDEKAKQEAKRAFDLSGGLSREDRLWVEGRYREITHEWDRMLQIYSTLAEFFPDNIDYGLKLVTARIREGKTNDALPTIDALRKLPSPLSEDPRIDLAEQEADLFLFDRDRAQAAADRALEKATMRGEKLLMAKARMAQGRTLRAAGGLTKAIPIFQKAEELFTIAGDQNGSADALNEIATLHDLQGSPLEAKQVFEQALTTYQRSGNERGVAHEFSDLGDILENEGDLTRAKEMFDQSLSIFQKIEDRQGVAEALNNLGSVLEDEGDLFGSRTRFEESLEVYQGIGLKDGIAKGLLDVGFVSFEQGDLAGAKRLCKEALKVDRAIGDKHFITNILSTLGEISLAQGNLTEAKRNFQEAFAIRTETGEDTQANSKLDLSLVAVEERRFQDAEPLARQAGEGFRSANGPYLGSYADAVLARSLAGQRKFSEAQEVVSHILPLPRQPMAMNIRLPLEINSAMARAASSLYANPAHLAEASALLNAALAEATGHGYLGYQFAARFALGEIDIKSGKILAGQERLTALERDARVKGFGLIAHKAAIARNQT